VTGGWMDGNHFDEISLYKFLQKILEAQTVLKKKAAFFSTATKTAAQTKTKKEKIK
jgi:hypothetical protein